VTVEYTIIGELDDGGQRAFAGAKRSWQVMHFNLANEKLLNRK
jgi:hypothetical protein